MRCTVMENEKDNFNPRSPRGLRRKPVEVVIYPKDFNPRSPRGLRQAGSAERTQFIIISIHAAQEGCDFESKRRLAKPTISIHAAQEGCDLIQLSVNMLTKLFQSTQPKRAATRLQQALRKG